MKIIKIITVFLTISLNYISFAQEPEPASFFPTQVGNVWQYYGAVTLWHNWSILQDSVAEDGYRYLYIGFERYPGQESWQYRIDSASNIYSSPETWEDTFFRSDTDSGDVWTRYNRPYFSYYSWIYNIYQDVVFGKSSIVKVVRSGPLHPDSGGNDFYDTEQYFASGFGVIYYKEEAHGELILKGCIINSDTFGVVTSLENISYDISEGFILKQNYPNPFNPATTIEFFLPQSAEVNISIFDILGRQVVIFFDGWMNAGIYRYKWNANDLSSGVYIAKLKANENIKTIKMLLIK